jgi:hypothetical protein
MLQTPTTETKQRSEASRTAPEQEQQATLHPRFGTVDGGPGIRALSGVPRLRQQFAGLHKTIGNQAVLRMLSHSGPAIQAKLTVNRPGDQYEQEADHVADQVMRMPDSDFAARWSPASVATPLVQRACACGGSGTECEECKERKDGPLQRKATGELAENGAPPIVHEVLRSPGQPLDHATRAYFEPRFGYNLEQVRVHTDTRAAESAAAIQALAYTAGNNLVFGTGQYAAGSAGGRRLLAHELVHVVQQSAVGTVRRQAASDSSSTTAPSDTTQRVLDALNKPDPVAGVGDVPAALAILRGLALEELLTTLIAVDDHFLMDVLVSGIGTNDQTEVGAAIYAVRFTSSHGQPDDQFGIQAARAIALIPDSDQNALIAAVLRRRGSTATVQQIREGLQALMESESAQQAPETQGGADEGSSAGLASLAGIAIGPWNPGGMPIPFYIGNAAHVAIAAGYAALHSTDAAFYNFTPVASILQAAAALGLTVNPALLGAVQLGLKPDIANITKLQLYEIKPVALQPAGRIEALIYSAALTAAGLPVLLGPLNEPGTAGAIPAPGGWFVYSAPEPGVITYRYRQPSRRQPANDTAPATDRSLVQRIALFTGLSGAALWIYITISEGSRVVLPVRNLVPLP